MRITVTSLALAAGLLFAGAGPAIARAETPMIQPSASVTANGRTLTVAPVVRLDPAGATLQVTGRGYDPTVGIYVALCVTPRKGQLPSPCGGGINTSGSSPASAWISSNPPPYGATLAMPYRPGGRFAVRLQVSAMVGDVDCRVVSCSIVTRADHTRPGDRRFDLAVRVTFSP